jgi:hypothetical protein
VEQEPQNQPHTAESQSASPAPPSEIAVAGGSVDSDDISRRAYRRFEERGFEHGRDLEDWLEAERESMSLRPNPTE